MQWQTDSSINYNRPNRSDNTNIISTRLLQAGSFITFLFHSLVVSLLDICPTFGSLRVNDYNQLRLRIDHFQKFCKIINLRDKFPARRTYRKHSPVTCGFQKLAGNSHLSHRFHILYPCIPICVIHFKIHGSPIKQNVLLILLR